MKFNVTFWIIVCQQLDIKLFSKGGQVRRHHAAGGQVDLVTAGLHLEQDRVCGLLQHKKKTYRGGCGQSTGCIPACHHCQMSNSLFLLKLGSQS